MDIEAKKDFVKISLSKKEARQLNSILWWIGNPPSWLGRLSDQLDDLFGEPDLKAVLGTITFKEEEQ